ncbi:uncharacterized protein LOC128262119 [Drosophila gunungcola]|uniref:DUF4729 domain-containing protein n=1 Tax=Drosophila gunungcola TaxID=103775 RepID=A0A9P9YTT8_9MUSC|nr:uncharacterized protein LOC128262119 [Drosophila gunungcola]XP_052852151.1 uncharacterized protein LOC128262119 [Drosophila gunungcola]XP_052852152.1 uncharacterized protein LOC128262119 [Drosophila gunungcola]KAI8042763.1 hypothetical protein M5D96_004086 [Drosophila gunungcola]
MNNRLAHLDLEALFGIPLMCPVAECESEMSPLEMLTHLLMHHKPQDSMTEIGAELPLQFEVELDKLTPGRNHVVGVIAYGGSPKTGLSRAVTPELQIVHNLPIILMLYVSLPVLNMGQVYIFYLVSPVASRRVNADISLLDGSHGHETRRFRFLRNSLDTPLNDNDEMLYCNMNFLMYTAIDIRTLCLTGSPMRIFVKIILHGEPDLFDVAAQQKVAD